MNICRLQFRPPRSHQYSIRQVEMMTGCSVKGCKNRSENGMFFKAIPQKPYFRALWLKNMNIAPSKYGRVCDQHFCEDQWETYGQKLKKNAVP